MSQVQGGYTKQTARNIFFGGTVFFTFLFAALIFHSETQIPERSKSDAITKQVIAGKHIWESNNCVGCHTILGEGAYFAPELGNVYKRRGGDSGAAEFIKGWMQSMPTGIAGRRQMPQFNLSDEDLDNLVAFLKWTSEVNTENWPPNIEG